MAALGKLGGGGFGVDGIRVDVVQIMLNGVGGVAVAGQQAERNF